LASVESNFSFAASSTTACHARIGLLRWILRDECRFSGSVLEHLAFYAAFALPQMYIVFSGMLGPKFFEFFF